MSDRIRAVIASVARLPVERIEERSRLADVGLGTSIAISILRTRLKNELGHETPELTWKSRVEDVIRGGTAAAATASSPTPASPSRAASPSAANGNLRVGIDLQDIAALPERGDPFYAEHFTKAELAAADARPDWRQHLCGIWCAKEAARKASAVCAALPFAGVEITYDAGGRPALRTTGASARALNVDVSITHSATAAAAVALAFE